MGLNENLNLQEFKKMFSQVTEKIQENENYLCKIDAAIGDGDHGTSMAKGFREAENRLESKEVEDVGEILKLVGKSLISKIGGATGPIFATVFMSAGRIAEGNKEVDLELLSKMFEKSVEDVHKRGGAEPGDKTMIDSLQPAVEGLKKAVDKNLSLKKGLQFAHERAEEGVKATKKMKPQKGRAKYLGKRALNHQDPGATSIALIFEAMKEYVEENSEKSTKKHSFRNQS